MENSATWTGTVLSHVAVPHAGCLREGLERKRLRKHVRQEQGSAWLEMRSLQVIFLMMVMPDFAHADVFNETVRSGSRQRMHTYMSWKYEGCVPNKAVVKVIAKPQHGTLTPAYVDATVRRSRHRAADPCIGKRMPGFQVDYRSEAGFRGTDRFEIEVTFGNRAPEIDTYAITVK